MAFQRKASVKPAAPAARHDFEAATPTFGEETEGFAVADFLTPGSDPIAAAQAAAEAEDTAGTEEIMAEAAGAIADVAADGSLIPDYLKHLLGNPELQAAEGLVEDAPPAPVVKASTGKAAAPRKPVVDREEARKRALETMDRAAKTAVRPLDPPGPPPVEEPEPAPAPEPVASKVPEGYRYFVDVQTSTVSAISPDDADALEEADELGFDEVDLEEARQLVDDDGCNVEILDDAFYARNGKPDEGQGDLLAQPEPITEALQGFVGASTGRTPSEKTASPGVGHNSDAMLVDEARELATTADKNDVKLMFLIKDLRDRSVHVNMGYTDLRVFYPEVIQLEYRKAKYFYDIADTFAGTIVSRETMADIGWTKLKEFKGLPKDKIPGVVALLQKEGWSTEALRNYVKATLSGGDHNPGSDNKKRKAFIFTEDQEALVQAAVKVAAAKYESGDWDVTRNGPIPEGLVMARIVGEWATSAKQGLTLEEQVARLEALYSVKLQVV